MKAHNICLFIINILCAISLSLPGPLLPVLGDMNQIPETTIGLIISSYAFSGIFAVIFMPFFIEILGRKEVMVLCTIGEGFCLFGYSGVDFVDEYRTLITISFIIRIFHGFFSSTLIMITYSLINSLNSPKEAPLLFSYMEIICVTGEKLGTLIAVLFYSLGGYSLPFVAVGVFKLMSLVVIFLVKGMEGRKKHIKSNSATNNKSNQVIKDEYKAKKENICKITNNEKGKKYVIANIGNNENKEDDNYTVNNNIKNTEKRNKCDISQDINNENSIENKEGKKVRFDGEMKDNNKNKGVKAPQPSFLLLCRILSPEVFFFTLLIAFTMYNNSFYTPSFIPFLIENYGLSEESSLLFMLFGFSGLFLIRIFLEIATKFWIFAIVLVGLGLSLISAVCLHPIRERRVGVGGKLWALVVYRCWCEV